MQVVICFMHKSPKCRALFDFDLEHERTFHSLKRRRAFQEGTSTSTMEGGEDGQRRTLTDYVTLGTHFQTPSITRLLVIANSFGLKLALISVMQQSQFGSTSMEDPNLHLSVFLEVYDN